MTSFGIIDKYKKIAAEENLTTLSVAQSNAAAIVESENIKNESIWNSTNSNTAIGTTTSEGYTIDTSAYEKQIKKAQNAAIAATAVSTLAQLATNFFANSSTGNSNLFSASGSDAVVVAPKVETIKTSNDIDDAISSYSKKSNDKRAANLTKEIGVAKVDKAQLADFVVEQDSIIKDNKPSKEKLEADNIELNKTAVEQQSTVDNLILGIVGEADANINELGLDNEEQDKIINESKETVKNAKKKCDATIKAQKGIISQNESLANSTPQPIKDAMGNITGYNPSQAQINQARQAIENAQKAIAAAQKQLEEVIAQEETGEESVQGKAKAKKAKNEEEIATWEAQKASPQSEELTAAKKQLSETREQISNNEASIATFKTAIDTATQKRDTAKQQMVQLTQKIQQAEGLLSTNKKEENE